MYDVMCQAVEQILTLQAISCKTLSIIEKIAGKIIEIKASWANFVQVVTNSLLHSHSYMQWTLTYLNSLTPALVHSDD